MTCSRCGGLVEWQGPLLHLSHTQCLRCGAINSQIPELYDEPEDVLDDDDTFETNRNSFGDS
jgi:hypothetical protein